MSEIIVERFLTADLERPLKTLTSKDVLMAGDRRAHRYHVRIDRGGEPVNDPGHVTAYFVRSDGTAVLMEGTVEDGNTAVVLLAPECYALTGWARLIVRVAKGESVLAVLDMQIAITKGEGGEIVDPGDVVPSLEELLAKIADLEAATEEARAVSGPILTEVASIKSDIAQLEQKGISATGVQKDKVPTANGDGTWEWKAQQGSGGGSYDDTEIREEIKTKAGRIIAEIETGNDVIRNAADAPIVDISVKGKTEQKRRFGYNLLLNDETEWTYAGNNVASFVFDDEDNSLTVTAKENVNRILQAVSKNIMFTDEQRQLVAGKTAVMTLDSSVSLTNISVKWGLFITFLNEDGNTINSPGWAFYNESISKSFVIPANAYGYNYLYRVYNTSASAMFMQGDWCRVSNVRMTCDTTIKPYLVKSVVNPVVMVGDTEATIPYILRGVNGVCDTVDMIAGTYTRRINPDIDNEVDEIKEDLSAYILGTPIVEELSEDVAATLKRLATGIGVNTVDGGGAVVRVQYVADTKKYIDGNTSQDIVSPEQYGAIGDGVADDTQAIQMALFGDNIVLGEHKVYKARPIVIETKSDKFIDGSGSTVLYDSTGMDTRGIYNNIPAVKIVCTEAGKTLTIKDLCIDANADSLREGDSIGAIVLGCMIVDGFDRVILDGVCFTGTYTAEAINVLNCRDITVRNCRFIDIGKVDNERIVFPNYRYGGLRVEIDEQHFEGSRAVVENCMFEKVGAACIDCRAQNVIIRNNIAVDIYQQFIENAYYLRYEYQHNITVEVCNNTFIRPVHAIYSNSVSNITAESLRHNTLWIHDNQCYDIGGAIRYTEVKSDPASPFIIVTNDNNMVQAPFDNVIIENNVFEWTYGEVKSRVIGVLAFANASRVFRNNKFINMLYNGIHGGTLRSEGVTEISGNTVVGSDNQFIVLSGMGKIIDINGNIAKYLIDGTHNMGKFILSNNIYDTAFAINPRADVIEQNNVPYSD